MKTESTSKMRYSISEKVSLTRYPNWDHIQILKRLNEGKIRYVKVPLNFMQLIGKRFTDIVDNGEVITLGSWEAEKVSYLGKDYISLVHKDEDSNRIG